MGSKDHLLLLLLLLLRLILTKCYCCCCCWSCWKICCFFWLLRFLSSRGCSSALERNQSEQDGAQDRGDLRLLLLLLLLILRELRMLLLILLEILLRHDVGAILRPLVPAILLLRLSLLLLPAVRVQAPCREAMKEPYIACWRPYSCCRTCPSGPSSAMERAAHKRSGGSLEGIRFPAGHKYTPRGNRLSTRWELSHCLCV